MKIALRGMKFYAYHGFFEIEQHVGGNYVVDVEIETPDERAGSTDVLEHTLNYANIYDVVKEEMKQSSKLIENVAGRILTHLRSIADEEVRIKVVVHKLNPPLGGDVDEAVVELQS